MSHLHINRVEIAGFFVLYGQRVDCINNVWVVGTEDEVVVIDASHDVAPIVEAIAGRTVAAIAITHGHPDHLNVADALGDATGAPVLIHPDDRFFWDEFQPDRVPDGALRDGGTLNAGTHRLTVIHTPGHSPGSVCFRVDDVVFSGDTIFKGGPGATDRPRGDFPTIIASIRDRLLVLPSQTVVHPGHGPSTQIGVEESRYRRFTDLLPGSA